jgi:hypothetical protein
MVARVPEGLAALRRDRRPDHRGGGHPEGEKWQRGRGVSLWLVGLNTDVLAMIQRSPLGETLGRERMHFNLEVAVAKYLASLAWRSEV